MTPRCVYCGIPGEFIVNQMAEPVACLEHLGSVVDDRMTLDSLDFVQVTRC